MAQRVEFGVPPIFEEIVRVFPFAKAQNVIFSWGDIIYARIPDLHPAILVHEGVHGGRQTDILDWWARYMVDPAFRLAEEIPAHIAEYAWWKAHGNRHERRAALVIIAKRLASPLYGSMTTRSHAETILRKNT